MNTGGVFNPVPEPHLVRVDAVGVTSDGDDLDGHRAVLAEGKLAVVVEVQLSQRAHRRQRQQQRKEDLPLLWQAHF